MDDKWSIDKLDGSNWITWKFQMCHLLMVKGLWKYVDRSAVLAEGASADDRAKFHTESQRAISTIVMSVSIPLSFTSLQAVISQRMLGIHSRSIMNMKP